MKGMNYKGYVAKVEFDPEDHIFVGHIIGIRDVVGFHGESVATLETAFREAVDNYLVACKKLGQEPNKPYSGNLMLRVPAEIHAAVAAAAEASGKSINQWAAKALEVASHAHARRTQAVEEGLVNPLRSFANLLTVTFASHSLRKGFDI